MIILINQLQDALDKQNEACAEILKCIKQLKTERANLIKELTQNDDQKNDDRA